MEEEVIIQTGDEVSKIDYMRTTNDIIAKQTDEMQTNIDTISEQLNIIIENTSSVTPTTSPNINLSEVTELIENIDTIPIESNTQDILVKINDQQQQINSINEKLDLILSKL